MRLESRNEIAGASIAIRNDFLRKIEKYLIEDSRYQTKESQIFKGLEKSFKTETGVKKAEENKTTNLTIAEKYWIVEHAEKHKKRSSSKLARDFTARFGRKIHKTTISRVLKKKEKIRRIGATGTQLDTKQVKQLSSEILQFQSDLADKVREIYIKRHITWDMIVLAGKELQNQPKYAENERVRKIRFSSTFIVNFKRRHNFSVGLNMPRK